MATKIKIMTMLQEMRGFSELERPQPTPKAPALFLMQWRNRRVDLHRTRRNIPIAFDLKDIATLPTAVAIRHVHAPVAEAR